MSAIRKQSRGPAARVQSGVLTQCPAGCRRGRSTQGLVQEVDLGSNLASVGSADWGLGSSGWALTGVVDWGSGSSGRHWQGRPTGDQEV